MAVSSLLCGLALLAVPGIGVRAQDDNRAAIAMDVVPAAAGVQMVRSAVPLPVGWLHPGESVRIEARGPSNSVIAAVRPITEYPLKPEVAASVRSGMITFPWKFGSTNPTHFQMRPCLQAATPQKFAAFVSVSGDGLDIHVPGKAHIHAALLAPQSHASAAVIETVEENAYYRWERWKVADAAYPRIIEVRISSLGEVTAIAHLQRLLPGDGRVPDFGWQITATGIQGSAHLFEGTKSTEVGTEPLTHSYAGEKPASLLLDSEQLAISQPGAPFKKRGSFTARKSGSTITLSCIAASEGDRAPMQQASWRRVEFCVTPASVPSPTPALQSPHTVKAPWQLYRSLYAIEPPIHVAGHPEVDKILQYHRDAIVYAMAHGDDWGNITGFNNGQKQGGAFGMNRLNHCTAIFADAFRTGDTRLLETAILWCDNFYDQSIWWGLNQTGGTRYNNVVAMGRKAPENDSTYMWRSNSAVSFCTKGWDAFWIAWEQTGDPRMKEAVNAQNSYAAQYLNAGRDYTRNIGCVKDFLNLYQFTGEQKYRAEAIRLFHDLRSQLSTGNLFTESGKPIDPDPPFIDEDSMGYTHPFAKPYIAGYALEGLPELSRLEPREDKLKAVITAVADFMAASQDPVGGWRYPHPLSSNVIMSQAMEHAWQISRADAVSGSKPAHLDAIEAVLRQRILGWQKTGLIYGGLTGWERLGSTPKSAAELQAIYHHPADRNRDRDYMEGRPDFGGSAPEGIVYFPDVLSYYLKHRPLSRLLTPADPKSPLGLTLQRAPEKTNTH